MYSWNTLSAYFTCIEWIILILYRMHRIHSDYHKVIYTLHNVRVDEKGFVISFNQRWKGRRD